MKLRHSAALALFVLGGCRGANATPAVQSGPGVPDFAAIDAYVSEELRSERIPGLALAIVHGTEIVHAVGFGTDGAGREVTPKTPFIIGSMSKAFASLALMQLVDQGRVDLDAPVQKYLPDFRVADSVASARITIRHLLNHTSGIPTQASRGTGDSLSLRAHVAALSRVELNNLPGSQHEYSSPNYLVLGAIIEQITGMSFGEYLQAKVFVPLGMQHSHVSQSEAVHDGMSRGHRYWFGFPRAVTLRHEADRLPTASIISSAEDLGHLIVAQLDSGNYAGRSVLSPAGIAQMHRPGINGSEGFSYAMGWRVSNNASGARVIHHGGIVPHFRGKMVLLPDTDWGVAVLTNVSSALPLAPASHRIADNIGAYLAGAPLPSPASRFKLVYWIVTIVVVLLSVNQVKQAMAAWRGRRSPSSKPLIGELFRLLLPAGLLVGLPLLIGIPWGLAMQSLPDIAWWLIVIASVDIAVRLYSIFRIVSQRESPT